MAIDHKFKCATYPSTDSMRVCTTGTGKLNFGVTNGEHWTSANLTKEDALTLARAILAEHGEAAPAEPKAPQVGDKIRALINYPGGYADVHKGDVLTITRVTERGAVYTDRTYQRGSSLCVWFTARRFTDGSIELITGKAPKPTQEEKYDRAKMKAQPGASTLEILALADYLDRKSS